MQARPGECVEIGTQVTVCKQPGYPEPGYKPLALLNLLTPMATDNARLRRRVEHLELIMWVIDNSYGMTFSPRHAKLVAWALDRDQDK